LIADFYVGMRKAEMIREHNKQIDRKFKEYISLKQKFTRLKTRLKKQLNKAEVVSSDSLEQ